MILLNVGSASGNKFIKQASICDGNTPVAKIYVKVDSQNLIAYSNYQLENAAVNYYNGFKYPDIFMQENTSNTSGAVRSFRYSGSGKAGYNSKGDPTDTLTLTDTTAQSYQKTRLLNRYDSFLITRNATTDTNIYNPNFNSTPTAHSYSGIDLLSSGGYDIEKFTNIGEYAWLYDKDSKTYEWKRINTRPFQGEQPSPVMFCTDNASLLKLYIDGKIAKTVETPNKVTFIYNLVPQVTYTYEILNSNSKVIRSGEFTTEGQIRMLKFDGIRNARDLGGYLTSDTEKRFKYGRVFRGGQLDVDVKIKTVALSEDDKTELANLGITKEVDLRETRSSDVHIPNASVTRVNGTSSASDYSSIASNFGQFLTFLKAVLSDITYVHCREGRDRTGTFCELLLALCGIEADGIYKDYELTSLWGNGSRRHEFLEYDYYDTTSSNGKINSAIWVKHFTIKALKDACGSTSNTMPGIVQDWFTANYTANSISGCDTASNAIKLIKDTLLEEVSSSPTIPIPTPGETVSNFSIIQGWKCSTSGEEIYKESATFQRDMYYELDVTAGMQVQIDDCQGHNWLIESPSGILPLFATRSTGMKATDNIWTKWTYRKLYGTSFNYTVERSGKLLIVLNIGAPDSITIKTSEGTIIPTEEIQPYNSLTMYHIGAYQASSVTSGYFTDFEHQASTYTSWEYYFIPALKGDKFTLKFDKLRPDIFFVESNDSSTGTSTIYEMFNDPRAQKSSPNAHYKINLSKGVLTQTTTKLKAYCYDSELYSGQPGVNGGYAYKTHGYIYQKSYDGLKYSHVYTVANANTRVLVICLKRKYFGEDADQVVNQTPGVKMDMYLKRNGKEVALIKGGVSW